MTKDNQPNSPKHDDSKPKQQINKQERVVPWPAPASERNQPQNTNNKSGR